MEYRLKTSDFITDTTPEYSDPEGDNPLNIRIVTLPNIGSLTYDGVPVNDEQVFSYPNDINDGELIYTTDENTVEAHTDYIDFKASDVGSELYSNIGTITFNIPIQNNPPTVSDNTFDVTEKSTSLNTSLFTKDFLDTDGDGFKILKITSLPNKGVLKELNNNISVNHTLEVINASKLKYEITDNFAIYNGVLYEFSDSLDSIIQNNNNAGYELTDNTDGILTFTNLDDETDSFTEEGIIVSNSDLCFNFRISDDSELESFSEEMEICPIPQGNVNIKDIYTNEPPIVGDNEVSTYYDEVYEFSRASFIDDTDPRFSDPDGDDPYKLKVLSLPDNGELLYQGQPVSIEDEFFFVGGIDDGHLTYEPDSTRFDISDVMFRFAVSDTGSEVFVE